MSAAVSVFAIYDLATGAIRRSVTCRPAQIAGQCADGERYVETFRDIDARTSVVDLASGLLIFDIAAPPSDSALDEARAHRDRLLAASDWTQVPDNRLTAEQMAEWAAVREQWRLVVDDIKAGLPARPWALAPGETPTPED